VPEHQAWKKVLYNVGLRKVCHLELNYTETVCANLTGDVEKEVQVSIS
jgi:hypothetical protein